MNGKVHSVSAKAGADTRKRHKNISFIINSFVSLKIPTSIYSLLNKIQPQYLSYSVISTLAMAELTTKALMVLESGSVGKRKKPVEFL